MTFDDKVNIAIERLKIHQPQEGYYLAFSGGKGKRFGRYILDGLKNR